MDNRKWFDDVPGVMPGSPQPHHNMNTPSLTGGLFDIEGLKHKPPDGLPDLDPELLSTLNLPRTSTDSMESSPSDASMMENWQMNEVFQDISDFLDDGTDNLQQTNYEQPTTTPSDIDQLVKDFFDDDALSSSHSPSSTEQLLPASETAVDLSWIIKETLGTDILSYTEPSSLTHQTSDLTSQTLDLTSQTTILDGFDLLGQLEAMPASSDQVVEPAPPLGVEEMAQSHTSVSECATVEAAVGNDHQYTQLAFVKVKPHETKKQAIRRVKNNAASRVCRKQRKNRLTNNIEKTDELMAQNSKLRESIREVESIVSLLKEHLVKATSKKHEGGVIVYK